ncbi:MAG: murein biosynthesis integral membrane protein MurJ [Inquilinus sp.]|uniref:murein biosynthesis integral membrane protein MurJ n=1 Tax=Inquilinus sp. TaxID=1932117 RepID=UPI003F3C594B
MYRKIASVGGLTLASRVLGLVRDQIIAAVLGAGPVADAFFLANRLPNHFRSLFAEGAFNVAFLPAFTTTLQRDGKAKALALAEQVQAILLAVLLVVLVAALAAMPSLISVMEPGGIAAAQTDLKIELTRITFPYLLFMSLVSLQGGVLNGLGRFGAAAAAPILLNLFMIGAVLGLTPFLPTAGHALAWGVFLSGIAQFLYLEWDMRRAGVSLRLVRPRLSPGVRRFFRALGPATLGAGMAQISVFADTIIAQALPTGAQSYLNYADRLNQLPLGVIGIAVGTVLLPEVTRRLAADDHQGALASQNRAIELTLALTLPFAIAFLVAAEPILAAMFERGRFTAIDSHQSALTLTAYAFGLPAVVLVRCLLPGFYARGDTATPVKIAVATVALNVGLKIALMDSLSQVGLAVGTSAGVWLNIILLAWVLHRRGHLSLDAAAWRRLPRMVLAGAAMAAALWGLLVLAAPALAGRSDLLAIATVLGVLAVAGLIYLAALFGLGALRMEDLRRLRRRG